MTKHDEIATLKRFVAALPENTYLRSALEPFVLEFEQGIYSDIVPSLRESWNERIEAQREAAEAKRAVEALRREQSKLEEAVVGQLRRIENAAGLFRDIEQVIGSAKFAADRVASSARSLLS